jgi:hypothetical protein
MRRQAETYNSCMIVLRKYQQLVDIVIVSGGQIWAPIDTSKLLEVNPTKVAALNIPL